MIGRLPGPALLWFAILVFGAASSIVRILTELGAQHTKVANTLFSLASLLNDQGDFSEAEAYYQQAMTRAIELGMRPLQAHCHRGLGTLYSQSGQTEQARAELSTAIELYREMEMTFWLPETEAALADVESQ